MVVADYGLISSVMQACGARNMVFQMQFNKPRETSDRGDIAKFSAAHELIRELLPPGSSAGIWLETRTGIDHFEPDLERAKKQLARSTLLQMLFVPQAIHIVSYCEALYAAKPEDIINSSQIIQKAVKVYGQNSEDINRHHNDPDVLERKSYLKKEALFLLEEIAALNPSYKRIPGDTAGITERRWQTPPPFTVQWKKVIWRLQAYSQSLSGPQRRIPIPTSSKAGLSIPWIH